MIYSVSIAKVAEDDIREAFLWYESQQHNLGILFEGFVTKAISSIQSNPLKTQVRYSNTRVFFLEKFPYGVHFQVDDDKNSVLIVAVLHTSQSPDIWRSRKG